MYYVYFRDCDRLESDWGIILFVVGGKDGMGYVDQGSFILWRVLPSLQRGRFPLDDGLFRLLLSAAAAVPPSTPPTLHMHRPNS